MERVWLGCGVGVGVGRVVVWSILSDICRCMSDVCGVTFWWLVVWYLSVLRSSSRVVAAGGVLGVGGGVGRCGWAWWLGLAVGSGLVVGLGGWAWWLGLAVGPGGGVGPGGRVWRWGRAWR